MNGDQSDPQNVRPQQILGGAMPAQSVHIDPQMHKLMHELMQIAAATLKAPLDIQVTDTASGEKKTVKITMAEMVHNIMVGSGFMMPMPVERDGQIEYRSIAQMLFEIADNTNDMVVLLSQVVSEQEEEEEPPPRRGRRK